MTNTPMRTPLFTILFATFLVTALPSVTKANDTNTDLWRYIANHSSLSIPPRRRAEINVHIQWFQKNPDYLKRVTKRAAPYLHLVVSEIEKANIPLDIALLPIVESAYYPFSYSSGSASGLWQFIPSTGRLYGLTNTWWYDGRRDVLASTKAAIKYLKNLNKLFDGDWYLAIAAYNGGPGRVQRAMKSNRNRGRRTDFWSLGLPRETRGYVPRLLAVAELIKNPGRYGQTLTPVANTPFLEQIPLNSQLDLALVADWTGLSLEDIYTYNPGLRRWATPDNYQLLLPLEKVNTFRVQLATYPKSERVKWVRHKIKSGETLSGIAHRHHTPIEQIKAVNKLSGNTIRAGAYLIIPMSQKPGTFYVLSEEERERSRTQAKQGVKSVHTVVSGDTLWGIAIKHNTTISKLTRWNKISRKKPLQIGQKLVIWKSKPRSTGASTLAERVEGGIEVTRKVRYKVRKGDNLSKIGRKFKVSVKNLAKWNKIDVNKPLQVGSVLTIFVNVVNRTPN